MSGTIGELVIVCCGQCSTLESDVVSKVEALPVDDESGNFVVSMMSDFNIFNLSIYNVCKYEMIKSKHG